MVPYNPKEDDTFSAKLHFSTRVADFSILFEEVIFVTLPGALFCLAVLSLVASSLRKRRDVMKVSSKRPLSLPKTVGILLFGLISLLLADGKQILHVLHVLLRVAFLVFWSYLGAPLTRCTLGSGTISILCAVLCACMSYRTHHMHARPCNTLLVYIFISTIADSARTRTLWLSSQYHVTLPALLTASLGVQLALLFFEARRLPGEYGDDISPQDLCSVFSQRFFFWLNPLIWQGRLRALSLSDLYPLSQQLKQERLMSILGDALTATQSLDFGIFANNTESYGITKLLLSALGRSYIKPILPRVLQVVFVVAQPLLLRTLSDFLSKDPSDPSSPSELGLPIIVAYVATYIGIAVSTGWYWHWVDRSIISTRGLLIGAILDKVLLLDVDRASDRGRIVTLVSGDVEKAVAGLESCHELWANALQAGIALWLIYGELGLIFIAPLAVSVAAGAGSMLIAKAARKRQALVMAAMEKRLDKTVVMCQSMRPLRMMGLFGVAAERVQGWRQTELDLMRHYRWMTIAAVVTCKLAVPHPQEVD